MDLLGIGKALAIRLAQLGAKVIAVSKSEENLKQLVEQQEGIIPVCVDLSDWLATKHAIKPHLPIHCLVNNAAVAKLDSFLDVKPEDFDM